MNLATQTDLEVYQVLLNGESLALGVLYDRYGSLVYRLALRMLSQPQEAEDLTQEVFLALWQKRAYDPKRGSLSSFLMTLTRSRAIDRLRTRGSNQRFLQRWGQNEEVVTRPHTPFEQASLGERSEQVKAALDTLPELQRQVVEMAYYEGLSQSEIAERLATPLGTVKTRGRQALIKLKRILQDFVG
ncbi:sigma-70 family RNA polymerase sigma factor [Anthocerotibacter panamensis]|uniref:sigma-70 family RNA polymerase sigma factor n=1 Tax=Anthocerotibacter panamensis TaxID=2857077 RepID=UPI001C40409E|nr:sigma-70 family RNA polymerase sigma factor [Anthocerotibacter panamensis]